MLGQTTDGHFPLQISRSCIVPSMRTSLVAAAKRYQEAPCRWPGGGPGHNGQPRRDQGNAGAAQAPQGGKPGKGGATAPTELVGVGCCRNLSTLALWRALLLCSGSPGHRLGSRPLRVWFFSRAALAAALAGDFFGREGAALWTARGVTASSFGAQTAGLGRDMSVSRSL